MDIIHPPSVQSSVHYESNYDVADDPEVIENVEDYQLGGFHPIAIGDCFSQGRYKVLHKLGHGGSSTVWLARDRYGPDPLVALKAMRADASSGRTNEISSLAIPKMLRAVLPRSIKILTAQDHFFVRGPNGFHLFLVSPLAGPSIASMAYCPVRPSGSKRLRADLARKVAKQAATAVYYMHRAGVVHGVTDFGTQTSLSTFNILFSLSPHILQWSDRELYANLGNPKTINITNCNGILGPPCAPAALIMPLAISRLTDAWLLREDVILADFGQSYAVAAPPSDYVPGTILNYKSPECRFENRVGLEADVWGLGCAIFETRAGFPLFETWFGSDMEILVATVSMLGRPPDPWWDAFDERATWFMESGEPLRMEEQKSAVRSFKTSIRQKLRSIGSEDEPPVGKPDGPMFEACGTRMKEEEVELLGDLLEKMLRYRPEERIRMDEVVTHPWFAFNG